jgi:hypothetical protein
MVLTNYSSPDELGLHQIHIACLRNAVPELLKLLSNGGNVEVATNQNETPLMLASLMGHVESVVILRQYHAHLGPIDRFRKTALFYASENAFSDIRRTFYAQRGFSQAEGAQYRRVAIASFLSSTVTKQRRDTSEAQGQIYFRKTSQGVEAYQTIGRVDSVKLDPRSKTVGFIHDLIDPTPQAWALSGWSKRSSSKHQTLLEGYKWKKAVLGRVAPAIGFKFPPHINDQGWKGGKISPKQEGQFFASHVECKLAVFYCFSLIKAISPIPDPSTTFMTHHLGDLARADLGDARVARIELDQQPCESCVRFLRALTKVTGIEFEPVYRRSFALIPEAIINRRYLLAHEADLTEPVEVDDGSDTDSEVDAAGLDLENGISECEMQQTNYQEGPILGGHENYEVIISDQGQRTQNAGLNVDSVNTKERYEEDVREAHEILRCYDKGNLDSTDGSSIHSEPQTSKESSQEDTPPFLLNTNALPIQVRCDSVLASESSQASVESTSTNPSAPSTVEPPLTRLGSIYRPIEIPDTPNEILLFNGTEQPLVQRIVFSRKYCNSKRDSKIGKLRMIKREEQSSNRAGRGPLK